MRPYHFDFDPAQTRRAAAILTFERTVRGGWRPEPPRRRGVELLDAAMTQLRLWLRRSRERQQLARLDLRMLRDIGVTPSEADGECSKPFWRD
ncbi:MAG TPA: DUF1127 domain-containing protein [Stellaceae bacterium]|nr:DUF1127 domain-containing protein [Stellaceae bacterium]